MAVVDLLEIVDVDHQHGHQMTGGFPCGDDLRRAFFKVAPVGRDAALCQELESERTACSGATPTVQVGRA